MRDLSATSAGEAPAPIEVVFERLSNVTDYPSWYPAGVKYAEELERGPDGEPSTVKTTLALAQGRIQRDFTLHLAVTRDRPRMIELRRLPKTADDRELVTITWQLGELGQERTRIEVALAAKLDIPRFLPLGGIADNIAGGFLNAAVASFKGTT